MNIPQFEHAIAITKLLKSSITHMDFKWQLYHSMNYLPATDVFDSVLERLHKCHQQIISAEIVADKKIQSTTDNKIISSRNPHLDSKLFGNLHRLRGFLYYDIENISDIVNALNYGFLNRLVGVVASEPTLGMEIASRQFGGIQLVYNATESLMKDYVENFENIEYKGIVVFGFKNRAVTYPPLVIHPSYSEHDLEYLMILAHEAYHLATQSGISDEIAEKLREIQEFLQEEVKEIAPLYLPETIKDRNVPDELIAELLADDLMADIYATIVAGEAYPRILCDYYLPILLDTTAQPPYSSFVIGSLKIRVAVTALKMLDWEGDAIKKMINSVNPKIEYWENLSKDIALEQLGEDGLNKLGLMDIEDKINSICSAIERDNIPKKMIDLIERPYYPKNNGNRKNFQKKFGEVKDILMGEPVPEDLVKIWENDVLTPRHLISLLAQEKDINRNAILIAMGYHKNILNRFKAQKSDLHG